MCGHVVMAVTNATKGGIQRSVRHRTARGAKGGKEVGAVIVQSTQFAQQFEHLSRKRYRMRLPHLHFLGRQFPDGLVELELLPLRLSQFPGANEEMWRELKREPGLYLALISFYRAQKGSYSFRIEDRSVVLYPRGDQRPL